jgi:hypothetical protein
LSWVQFDSIVEAAKVKSEIQNVLLHLSYPSLICRLKWRVNILAKAAFKFLQSKQAAIILIIYISEVLSPASSWNINNVFLRSVTSKNL